MVHIFVKCIVVLLSIVAVCMDVFRQKVDNQFIVFGWIFGLGYQIGAFGPEGAASFFVGAGVAIFLLYPLFYFRMLGAGDVKVLSVLGGFIGPLSIIKCIFVSFLFGAVISIAVILICGNLIVRLKYFKNYVSRLIVTKKVVPYYLPGKRMENIHFTVPILMSVLVFTGGLLG